MQSLNQQKNAELIRDLLSKILCKKYPQPDNITETELLEWPMWPSFLGHIGKCSNFIKCNAILLITLVNDVQEQEQSRSMIIAIAFSQLDNLCESIIKKSITLESLEYIRSKRLQLQKLCDAVNSGKGKICVAYNELEPHLNECFTLSAKFMDHQRKVANLLEFCDEYHGMLI